MSTLVCVKDEEDPGEKLSQDEIISRTKQVIQGLDALKQEHHSILEGLLGTLRCLKQDEEGVLMEEKSHMIRKSLEMLELGLSEAQVSPHLHTPTHTPTHTTTNTPTHTQLQTRLHMYTLTHTHTHT